MKPDEQDLEPKEDLPAFTEEEGIPNEGEITVPAVTEEETEEKVEETPSEEVPKYQFKTDEELDTFIKSRQVVTPTPETPKTPEKAEGEEEDEFANVELFKGFRDPKTGEWVGEAPNDWNDFARRLLKHASPKTIAPKVVEQIKQMTQKEREELQRIDAEFDKEYETLATQGLVPHLNTPEGAEVNKQITNIGATYGQSSMIKAHELWSKIPKASGGGLDYTSPAKPKVNPSKAVAAKQGSSAASGNAGRPTTKIPYNKLHSARSIDELIEEDL